MPQYPLRCMVLISLACLLLKGTVWAQPQSSEAPASEAQTTASADARKSDSNLAASAQPSIEQLDASRHANELALPWYILEDQKEFWTSPLHLQRGDFSFLVPFLGVSSGLVASDTQIEKNLPKSAALIKRSNTFSNLGIGAFAGAAGGFYFLGQVSQNQRMHETGLLSAEAVSDGLIVTETFKGISERQRPLEGDHKGAFWKGGSSFPSEHASAAWSVASIFAHEYPGTLTKLLAYGAATAISASRVTSRNHFSSDAFIGSVLGWYIGSRVYQAHHDPELDGAQWGSFDSSHPDQEEHHNPDNVGSPYVPLDSWIYPAFDRLAALGYAPTASLGIRPWTRLECARLLEESTNLQQSETDIPKETSELLSELRSEFSHEIAVLGGASESELKFDSVYVRSQNIAGKPLTDGYHFGQTIVNDFGRPFSEGENLVGGLSGWAVQGPFTVYFRGEYQHAPALPAQPQSIRTLVSTLDLTPVSPATLPDATNQFRLLDTYVAANFKDNEFSFGKQSLSWGTGRSGGLLFSNNVDPIYMFRMARVTPFKLPWIFGYLGPLRTDLFLGKLSGHHFPARPLIHGEKFSFKPTPNLEFGFSRTVVFAGVGHPLTGRSFDKTYLSLNDNPGDNSATRDPGDRKGGFDFSYRLPGLRNWLTLYNDSFSDDDPSPIAAPRRAAMNPGLYLVKFPGVPKLDLHAEAVYTEVPGASTLVRSGRFIYWNLVYKDGYTNKGDLVGNWIGRDGTGFQAWSTYWFSPKNNVQIGYRDAKIDAKFVPGGGTVNDMQTRANWWLKKQVSVSAFLQHERWKFPVLSPNSQNNFTASFEVDFHPTLGFARH